ncbi:PREDICTED: targeting protein for Xklp2-A [Dufourea novaeangliae]|uniref:Targeting protein for Xklp2 n=1 Tax=Dufourea novaeangliae TaxID=178035 RepID=A0A154PBA6_DUFNO|nr:PREDICTED: targeting protein for Xklp2-A [Dufourea novaeangliae]XP_015430978.1 PREDICTED: targeting protein for Xklp2-A [Dufourea novaeangliae]KZC09175.1 Targeting protein for Xklp2 [Dufourea novaeangliae]
MMDNCCAPQWADFTSSPQLPSDNYFELEHEVHSTQIYSKTNSKVDVPILCKEENLEKSSVEESYFDDSLESVKEACPNVAYFIPHDNKKQPAEGTNNDILKKERQTSKFSNLYDTWNVSVTDLTSALKSTSEPQRLTAARERIRKSARLREMKSTNFRKSPAKTSRQTAPTKVKIEPTEYSKITECTEDPETDERLSYKVVKTQRRQSDLFKAKRSQPKVLTCQYRRRSLMKYHRRSNQFVSMAEAISKFQNGTPQRFRTTSNKTMKPGPLIKLKRSPLKLTVAVSPALRCKQRVRHTNVMTKEEREAMELQEMRKHQIKANPVPVNILKGPSLLKKVAKKPSTVTEEFKLSKPKKTRHTMVPGINEPDDKKHTHKSTVQLSRSVSASNVTQKTGKEQARKSTVSLNRSTSASTVKKEFKDQGHRNTVPIDRSISASSVARKEHKEQNRHGSTSISRSTSASSISKKEDVKQSTDTASRPTKSILPFCFEARNKEFQSKRVEKLKSLQVQEYSKLKTEFHARPIPKFTKPLNPVKEPIIKKRTVAPCPFSFAERDKSLAKKKEELVKQMQENSKKVRVFHASPAPTFKPVVVHGLSKEKNVTKKMTNSADQENKQPNIIVVNDTNKKETKQQIVNDEKHMKSVESTDNVNDNEKQTINQRKSVVFELNTDKRAKERCEFDEKLKKREQELEAKRREEEKKRLLKEKFERAELRKLTEVKATPMPVYKPVVVLKSTKPPTSPKDPKWAHASKLKSTS